MKRYARIVRVLRRSAQKISLRGITGRKTCRMCAQCSLARLSSHQRTLSTSVARATKTGASDAVRDEGYDRLSDVLVEKIRRDGPMTLAAYMREALTHPKFGYYTRRAHVIGREGDFVTAPELTSLFGESIGLWILSHWKACAEPSLVRLVELGPGRGTLMRDVLAVLRLCRPLYQALCVHMVEVSPVLRERQRQALEAVPLPRAEGERDLQERGMRADPSLEAASLPPMGPSERTGDAEVDKVWEQVRFASPGPGPSASSPGLPSPSSTGAVAAAAAKEPMYAMALSDGPTVTWHRQLSSVPSHGWAVHVAHELFDALPAHQILKTTEGWREVLVAERETGAVTSAPDGYVTSAEEEARLLGLGSWDRARAGPGAPSPRSFDEWGGAHQLDLDLGRRAGASVEDGARDRSPYEGKEEKGGGSDREGPRTLRMVLSSEETPAVRFFRGGQSGGSRLGGALGLDEEQVEQLTREAEQDDGSEGGTGGQGKLPSVGRVPASVRALAATELNRPSLEEAVRGMGKGDAEGPTERVGEGEAEQRAESKASMDIPDELPVPPLFRDLKPIVEDKEGDARSGSIDTEHNDGGSEQKEGQDQDEVGRLLKELGGKLRDHGAMGTPDAREQAGEQGTGRSSAEGEEEEKEGEGAGTDPMERWMQAAPVGTRVEYSPSAAALAHELAVRVAVTRGLALVVDYGHDRASAHSLRGIRNHAFTHPLERPGDSDVTVDVDFRAVRHAAEAAGPGVRVTGPMDQSEFLQRMAIVERAQSALAGRLKAEQQAGGSGEETEELRVKLEAALRRLLHPGEMGSLYKMLAISSAGAPVPTPFEHSLSPEERRRVEREIVEEQEKIRRRMPAGAGPPMPDF